MGHGEDRKKRKKTGKGMRESVQRKLFRVRCLRGKDGAFWVGTMALDKWEQTFPEEESWGSRAQVPVTIPASVMALRSSKVPMRKRGLLLG